MPLSAAMQHLLEDTRLTPFLPMIYIAWADGQLEPEEMGHICGEIRRRAELSGPCSEVLGGWLDPDQPPAAEDLQDLLNAIREGTSHLSGSERLTLAELGLALAETQDGVSDRERRAVVDVEAVLDLANSEAARQLLATRRPPETRVVSEPAFPVALMAHTLDGRYANVHNQVRSLLAQSEFAYVENADRTAYREQVLVWCRALAKAGFGALSFPAVYGGKDDMGAFIAAFESIAFHDLSLLVKFGVQFGLFGGSIQNLGTQHHHDRFLRDVASLDLPGCFAMTETGHGSNVQDLETVARYDPATDTFEIHTPHPGARKDYIGNAAAHGRLATVFAQLEVGGQSHGVHALLVPIRKPDGSPCDGVTIEDNGEKMGLNGVDNGRLMFDHVRVPRDHLLDRFASVDDEGRYASPIPSANKRFFTMLGTLVGGRVSIACAAASAAKSALAIAVRYANRRRQFGPADEPEIALLDYPPHPHRLLLLLATTYALHFALRDLTDRYAATQPGDDRRELEHRAAGLKALSTWHATDTIQVGRECCGGQGFLAVNRFAALKADSDIFTTFEGDNTVLLQLVGKGLLTSYKKQFHEINLYGLMRFISQQARTSIAELNPIVTRQTDEAHLRDRDFHQVAFRWREAHLLASVARRLRSRIRSGMDSNQALIECQDHLLETAVAHAERLILDHFVDGIAAAPEALRPILTTLCDLYALHRLEADRGWFLEQGYFEPAKAKAIRKQVNALCGELRPQAEPLVDAFGIPMALLAAPIAQ